MSIISGLPPLGTEPANRERGSIGGAAPAGWEK
jgi:hypothetical protein